MSTVRETCRHGESMWGRCVACGLTWEEQAHAATPPELVPYTAANRVESEAWRTLVDAYRDHGGHTGDATDHTLAELLKEHITRVEG